LLSNGNRDFVPTALVAYYFYVLTSTFAAKPMTLTVEAIYEN